MKTLWGWLWRIAVGIVLLFAAWQAPLIWPEPFFAHCVKQGRLSLCSDRPFDERHAKSLLSDVAARLARSPLDDRLEHRVFVSNAAWRVGLFMSHAGSAAAFSIYPVSRNVFTRHADIDANTLFHASGDPSQPPRTLVYYMTHEITHALTGEHMETTQWRHLPIWAREGYADYVGMGSGGPEDDARLLYQRYRGHDPAFDALDRTYYRYRMLTAYFLEMRGWSVGRLLASTLMANEAQKIMDQDAALKP